MDENTRYNWTGRWTKLWIKNAPWIANKNVKILEINVITFSMSGQVSFYHVNLMLFDPIHLLEWIKNLAVQN